MQIEDRRGLAVLGLVLARLRREAKELQRELTLERIERGLPVLLGDPEAVTPAQRARQPAGRESCDCADNENPHRNRRQPLALARHPFWYGNVVPPRLAS